MLYFLMCVLACCVLAVLYLVYVMWAWSRLEEDYPEDSEDK